MLQLAETCERIAATTKKLEKTAIVAEYLRSRDIDDAAISAVFLSGRAFPAFEERTLQVGGSLLWKVVKEVTGASEIELNTGYRKTGDLGASVYEVLVERKPRLAQKTGEPRALPALSLQDVRSTFEQIATTRTANAKGDLLKELLDRASPVEAKYILKIITGELRIGLKESLVEEAIAKAHDEPLAQVQRANMLLGDIGETLRLAAEHRLHAAHMRLFHPIGFMLASPAADAAEAFEYFEHALVEDKYDGIRAQAHCAKEQLRLFSRTLDEVTSSFPELASPLSELQGEVVLDGEIVAWRHTEEGGHAMPFSEIQKRLGRKQVSDQLMKEVPIAYVVFDVLYAEGELTLQKTLSERSAILDRVFSGARRVEPKPIINAQGQLLFEAEIQPQASSGWILRAPATRADSIEQLERLFAEAMARGNEGLMIKDVNSPYMPGRRGRWWLKLKRELATLDVVVTRAEFGNGKRAQVLSDYTFAVRKGEELVNIGKAYTGLTDLEIAEMTQWFFAHTITDYGHVRDVEPTIVIEVAFNAVMRSDRHDSGFALRFPRIVRIRHDKLPAEIDTIEQVETIYRKQHGRSVEPANPLPKGRRKKTG
jgi:DNA ligase 1